MFSQKYIDYLQSQIWKERRLAALERAEFRCQLCGETDKLEVHHLTYERLGYEDPNDLMVICKSHHWEEDERRRGTLVEPKPIFRVCEEFTKINSAIDKLKKRRIRLSKHRKTKLIELNNQLNIHVRECKDCSTIKVTSSWNNR